MCYYKFGILRVVSSDAGSELVRLYLILWNMLYLWVITWLTIRPLENWFVINSTSTSYRTQAQNNDVLIDSKATITTLERIIRADSEYDTRRSAIFGTSVQRLCSMQRTEEEMRQSPAKLFEMHKVFYVKTLSNSSSNLSLSQAWGSMPLQPFRIARPFYPAWIRQRWQRQLCRDTSTP